MFKKLHSNRDPDLTVYGELKKEFNIFFDTAGHCIITLVSTFPKFLFGAMVLLIILSLVLSFAVFHQPVVADQPAKVKQIAPLSDGFERILQTGSALKETITIKKQVDSLTAKQHLSAADTLRLAAALDRLQQLNHQLIQNK